MSGAFPRDVVRRRGPQARAVGAFVPKLTGKAFEKYGFSTVALLTDWTTIAGAELATYTMPERLKWPRGVDAYSETPAGERGRPGATLLLRVDGARALDVQYRSAEIIERINAFFGYQAVSQIRFIQAPVEPPRAQPTASLGSAAARGRPQSASRTETDATDAPTSALDAALARLEASVRSASPRSANA